MKRVLITGAGSYIGTSFEAWAAKHHPGELQIDTVDMVDGSWREKSFEGYDAVFHVAAIVHRKEKPKMRELYWKINCQLPIEVAKKAKAAGVKQFVFMSSMNVYGMKTGVITKETKEYPTSFYGESKLAAEKELMNLMEEKFQVSVLRPPMVYGNGCKGNYQLLKRFVLMCPIFPEYSNQRSMLYIDNLSEYIIHVIEQGQGGLYFPQNREYMCTTELVRKIAEKSKKKIYFTKMFNRVIHWGLVIHVPLVEKLFGTLIYEK